MLLLCDNRIPVQGHLNNTTICYLADNMSACWFYQLSSEAYVELTSQLSKAYILQSFILECAISL